MIQNGTKKVRNYIKLLTKKMFTKCKSSLLRQYTLNQYLFVSTAFRTSCCHIIQPYFERNFVFVNNGILVNLPPPSLLSILEYTSAALR